MSPTETAVDAYENSMIDTFAHEIEKGNYDPVIYDLQQKKAREKYETYIRKVIALQPREFTLLNTKIQEVEEEKFISISRYLIYQIFGEKYLPEFDELVEQSLTINESSGILDGISLEVFEAATGKKVGQVVEIPDAKHITSIIALIHEFIHYHCQKAQISFNKKRYYEEILSIYAEKRATTLLATILSVPELNQIISETRLNGISWHYKTHDDEMKFLFNSITKSKKLAQQGDIQAAQYLMQVYSRLPWARTPKGIQNEEVYRKNLAASYGIGYLYADSLLAKYLDDGATATKKIDETLSGEQTLEELLGYYGINTHNREVYNVVKQDLQNIRKGK